MITVTGRRASPEFKRAVVRDHLQLHRQEEERPAERAVDDEGHGVGATELADAEERERQHRVGAARSTRRKAGAASTATTKEATTSGLAQPRAGPSIKP